MCIDLPRIDYKNKSSKKEKEKTDLEIVREYNKRKGEEAKLNKSKQ